MQLVIRKERTQDITHIHNLITKAFDQNQYSDGKEQFIVDKLRSSGALTVSLVAVTGAELVGHVALSPVTLSNGADSWYGLGPISVLPNRQRQGVGAKLMYAAIAELRRRLANGCVLLGDPQYYHRFGFRLIEGLVLPDAPPEYFQALSFVDNTPSATVSYHASFSM